MKLKQTQVILFEGRALRVTYKRAGHNALQLRRGMMAHMDAIQQLQKMADGDEAELAAELLQADKLDGLFDAGEQMLAQSRDTAATYIVSIDGADEDDVAVAFDDEVQEALEGVDWDSANDNTKELARLLMVTRPPSPGEPDEWAPEPWEIESGDQVLSLTWEEMTERQRLACLEQYPTTLTAALISIIANEDDPRLLKKSKPRRRLGRRRGG